MEGKLLVYSMEGSFLSCPELRMKRRASDRGAGETSAKAKALGNGIAGNNAKRAGPFVLGKSDPGGGGGQGLRALILTYQQQSEEPTAAVLDPDLSVENPGLRSLQSKGCQLLLTH